MRIKIQILPKNNTLILPLHYRYGMEAFFYNIFSQELSNKLHEVGFLYEKRHFKLFVFSNVSPRGRIEDKKLVFHDYINIYFSSPVKNILIDEINNLIMKREFILFHQPVVVGAVQNIKDPVFSPEMTIKTLSPIVVYSTFKDARDMSKTYYYSPHERGFSRLIEKNAKKKYKLLYNKDSEGKLYITPLRFSKSKNEVVTYIKNTIIKGYTGVYRLSGDVELIKTTYHAGLGSKNPSGFGMWEEYELL